MQILGFPESELSGALRLSRIRPGDAQRACLGQYINLTDAPGVQESLSHFAEPANKNEKLQIFFRKAFAGEPAEEPLQFRPEGNWYEIPR